MNKYAVDTAESLGVITDYFVQRLESDDNLGSEGIGPWAKRRWSAMQTCNKNKTKYTM